MLDAESVNPALTAETLTLTIEDNDAAITYTLTASPETVVEGGAVTTTATASRMVQANTEVKLVRDPASTAGDDDFSFDAPQMGVITIVDGETSGSLTLTATDDDPVEDEESLTLNGTVGDTAAASVTLTIEDRTVITCDGRHRALVVVDVGSVLRQLVPVDGRARRTTVDALGGRHLVEEAVAAPPRDLELLLGAHGRLADDRRQRLDPVVDDRQPRRVAGAGAIRHVGESRAHGRARQGRGQRGALQAQLRRHAQGADRRAGAVDRADDDLGADPERSALPEWIPAAVAEPVPPRALPGPWSTHCGCRRRTLHGGVDGADPPGQARPLAAPYATCSTSSRRGASTRSRSPSRSTAKSRLEAETICVTWEKSNTAFGKVADEQLAGVPEAMRENPATLGREGAVALQGALYQRVTLRTEEHLTVAETETKGGLTGGITMAPDEIDRAFAVNGLDEYFHHNVMGGERLREAARQAVTAARGSELRWETGQMVPALQPAGQQHRRGPDLLR